MSIFVYIALIILQSDLPRCACKILRFSKKNYKWAVFVPEVRASVKLVH